MVNASAGSGGGGSEEKFVSVGEISLERLLTGVLGLWRCEEQASDGENRISRGIETEKQKVGAWGSRAGAEGGVKKAEPRLKGNERKEFT